MLSYFFLGQNLILSDKLGPFPNGSHKIRNWYHHQPYPYNQPQVAGTQHNGYESVSIRMRNELHWLRFPQRITFKLCLLTFKALHDQAPVYLVRRCVRVSSDAGRARLRSASSGQLVVPRTFKKTFGDRAFASSGPISWNCLSSLVRDDCLSLHSFKKLLKTALF